MNNDDKGCLGLGAFAVTGALWVGRVAYQGLGDGAPRMGTLVLDAVLAMLSCGAFVLMRASGGRDFGRRTSLTALWNVPVMLAIIILGRDLYAWVTGKGI